MHDNNITPKKVQEEPEKNTVYLPVIQDDDEKLFFAEKLAKAFVRLESEKMSFSKGLTDLSDRLSFERQWPNMLYNGIVLLLSAEEHIELSLLASVYEKPEIATMYIKNVKDPAIFRYWTVEMPTFTKKLNDAVEFARTFNLRVTSLVDKPLIQSLCNEKNSYLVKNKVLTEEYLVGIINPNETHSLDEWNEAIKKIYQIIYNEPNLIRYMYGVDSLRENLKQPEQIVREAMRMNRCLENVINGAIRITNFAAHHDVSTDYEKISWEIRTTWWALIELFDYAPNLYVNTYSVVILRNAIVAFEEALKQLQPDK